MVLTNKCVIIGKQVSILYFTEQVTIATIWPAKNILNFSFKCLLLKRELARWPLLFIIELSKAWQIALSSAFLNIIWLPKSHSILAAKILLYDICTLWDYI